MRPADPADNADYCRVIVRIREQTHRGVMDMLSASGHGDLSALVEDLLGRWLAGHEGGRPPKKRAGKP